MIENKGWFFPDIDSHFQRHTGVHPNTDYQQKSIDVAFSLVKNFNNVIDIGANIGLHSVRFSQKFKNVFSFEPVKSNFQCLEKNCSMFKNIKLFNNALGNEERTDIISIPKNSNNCGAYSLVDFIDYTEELTKEEIHIKKLDNFNLQADLIKIDTQGYENIILQGAIETIRSNLPVLLIEIVHQHEYNEIEKTLSNLDYKCVSVVKKDKIWVHKNYEI